MSEESSSLMPKENHKYGTIIANSSTSIHEDGSLDQIQTIDNSVPSTSGANNPDSSMPSSPPADQMRSTLSLMNKIGYGLGHVYNDLCAGVWFSYTLLFMQNALLFPAAEAGALMMLGQVGDALATPVVGYLTDRFGTKQKWHMLGTALVFVTFPLIFSICPGCTVFPYWWHLFYFSIVILAFQCGWAIVQVTHLAIIPEMARTQKDRAELTAMRYSASVVSNVIVFIVTWAVLHANQFKTDGTIGPDDAYRFRDISLILTLVGISMTVCFHFSLSLSGYGLRRIQALQHTANAPSSPKTAYSKLTNSDDEETVPVAVVQPRKNFFKSILLYQNAFLYVFSRLFMTTALVYIPLWLDERAWQPSDQMIPNRYGAYQDVPDKNVEHIATVPMVSFLASFISSMAMKYSHRYFGHQVAYLLGSIISVSGCVLVGMTVSATSSTLRLYMIALLFGAGSSVTMISSLCITADMIGRHADQSGFIYSAVTFADKLITGIAVIIIESLKCKKRTDCPDYYKNILAYACGGAAVLGAVTLFTLKISRRRRNSEHTV